MAYRRTLALLDAGNYGAAADEMLNSRWAKQTPGRAKELAQIVREQR
jgi:lysozyme